MPFAENPLRQVGQQIDRSLQAREKSIAKKLHAVPAAVCIPGVPLAEQAYLRNLYGIPLVADLEQISRQRQDVLETFGLTLSEEDLKPPSF